MSGKPNDPSQPNPGNATKPTWTNLAVAAASVLIGFAAIYVTLGGRDNAPASQPSSAATPSPTKLNSGEMAGFVFKKEPEAAADIAFVDGAGAARTLRDWHGRVVLLNLWATWCAPCRKEMPALGRLQKEMGSKDFEVVALAIDRAGLDVASKFLGSVDAAALSLYVDQSTRSGTALKLIGMPTTLLIDRQGREVGRLTGPAEWDSADAKRLIAALLK